MVRIVVVANPSASQFTGGAHRAVMSILEKVGEVESVWPESTSEAETRAARAAAAGVEVVVAMGGDGIVHHVAQGVVGTGTALGVIPAGTTNVIARLLRIPLKPVKAARLLIEPDVPALAMGTARMTLTRGSVETIHHAVFAGGFGLDAAVVLEADKDPYRKYRFGSIHYAGTALRVAFGQFPGREPNVTVRFADSEQQVTTALVQFREIYTYFGPFPLRVGPDSPDPMTLLTIAMLKRRHIPRIVATLLRNGDLDSLPGFTIAPGLKRVEVTADPPVAAEADGESLGMVDGGTVEWAPESLRVIAPQPLP